MPSDTNEPGVPEFHSDPVINAGLSKIEAKAAFYELAHGVITGKFDQNYSDWLRTVTVVKEDVENVPEVDHLVEWMHIDANLSELLTFKDSVGKLMTELNLAIFGHYAKKNVRGSVPADTDLSAVRAELVKILNGTVTMIEAGILEGMTVDMILNLPTLKKFAVNNGSTSPRRADGTWILPNAPAEKNGENTPSDSKTGLRSHNTQVKLVVDGVLDNSSTLGEACSKIFGVKKPAEISAKFENWSADYFAVGDEQPKKAVLHDGKKVWLTKVG